MNRFTVRDKGHGTSHFLNEHFDVIVEILVAVPGTFFDENSPAAFDLAPCFHKRAFTGFNTNVVLQEFGGDGLRLCADVRGIAPQARAIDSILLGLFAFATDGTRGGIRRDAEQP